MPGPRYTSYPPAPQFTDQVTWPEVAAKISQAQSSGRGLSLYFHIPFCESLCWYCGCTTVITTQREKGALYLQYLDKEMERMSARLNPQRQVVQLHWGGGTPTFLSPDEIRVLGQSIRKHFNLAPGMEAGVEIDPRRLTRDHFAALREVGFNRASIGVQDFNPTVQTAMHRIQPREQTEQAMEWARAAGFQSINLDLIYGLPYQTVESFEETLDEIIKLGPDRLAVFSYAHVPWMKPAQKILEQALAQRGNQAEHFKTRHREADAKRPATPTSAWITSRGRRMNWRWRNARKHCSEISRDTAPKAGRTFMPSACRPFRRPTASIGKTSRIWPDTTRPWIPAGSRLPKATF